MIGDGSLVKLQAKPAASFEPCWREPSGIMTPGDKFIDHLLPAPDLSNIFISPLLSRPEATQYTVRCIDIPRILPPFDMTPGS